MYSIEQRTLTEQPTVVVRDKVAVADLPTWFGHIFEVTAQAVGQAGAEFAGPPFARYRVVGDGIFEVEAGFPVMQAIATAGEAEPSILPGGPAITTWHIGPYDAMTPGYTALQQWLDEHAAVATGPPWEQYYSEPTGDPAAWRTLLVQPYRT
jgi:effector-binding domain-containing protein